MGLANSEFEEMRTYEYLQLSTFKQAYTELRLG
jgi:hypothetical protein